MKIMYILVSIEQNDKFSLALGDKESFCVKEVNKPYSQAELLLKTIDEILNKKKNKLTDLKAVFVVSGPGQFSALRIGVATANTLAYALKIKVVGVKLQKKWLDLPEDEKLAKVWQKAIEQMPKTKKSNIVIPKYGSKPNIT